MSEYTIPITRPSSVAPQTTNSSVASNQTTTYPTEWIDLPSGGYFYQENHPLSSGKVEVKTMTAREEDILTNSNFIKNGVVLDRLLESVLIDKNIKINDFLVGDKNAVFVALRRLAYGDNYGPLSIKCPTCREDNKDVVINLNELKYKEANTQTFIKNLNEFEFVLPTSKKKITFKILTGKDENDIEAEIKTSQKLKLPSSELTTRLRVCMVSVDDNTDKQYIRKFVENELLTRDSLALRTYMQLITPNIDMNFNFTCSHCGSEDKIGVPLTAAFFWPDSAR
jgi:hypothetical protein